MSGIINALQWIIANWQMLTTIFSSFASIALFFMHGNAKQELQELKDLVNSIGVPPAAPAQPPSLDPNGMGLKNK